MSSIVIQGDTSGSITVEAPSVAGTHTLTLPKATGNIATDATVGLGMKNRIINGNMVIDQRNAGASITPTGSVYTVDRWQGSIAASSKLSFQQSTDAPIGFTNSMLITTVSAYTAGAAEYFSFFQPVEGYNISDLAWGSASAKTVTLSFWIKSSLTGTFSGALQNNGASRSYPFTYTISSANTWEQKSVTIAGDTTGTWLTANNKGMEVHFDLGSGSDRRGTAGAWNSNWNTGTTGSVSLIQTGSATLYISAVQLEQSDNSTPFENRMYGTELALCQRYCQVLGGGQFEVMMVGAANSTTASSLTYKPPVNFRTIPSMSYSDIGDFQLYRFTGVTTVSVTSASLITIISSTQYLYVDWNASPLTTGEVVYLRSDNTTSSKLIFSAEL